MANFMLALDGEKFERVFRTGNYHFEVKYDGERCQIRNGVMFGRSERNITDEFPEFKEMLSLLNQHYPNSTFDGEVFVPANKDIKDKPTTSGRTVRTGALLSKVKPAVFMCFDVLRLNGEDLTQTEYEIRKEELSQVDRREFPCFDAVYPVDKPDSVWAKILERGDEGMVAKLAGSKYEFRRSDKWLKLKTWQEADYKVVGFTSEKREVSSLILEGGLKVNCALSGELYGKLVSDLVSNTSGQSLVCNDGTKGKGLIKPYMAKVKFLSATDSGLRFPTLRELVM